MIGAMGSAGSGDGERGARQTAGVTLDSGRGKRRLERLG